MSEFRLTDGNLIVIYALTKSSTASDDLPDHIKERVKVTLETYSMVSRSKPDKDKTMVIVNAEPSIGKRIKDELVEAGVSSETIAIDSDSENTSQLIERVYGLIKTKPNPPFIYFVGPYWLQDVYKSTVLSRLKNYKIQFYGAIDHRSYDQVEQERASDAPKQGGEYYKQKIKNKAVDMLLNVIFPD